MSKQNFQKQKLLFCITTTQKRVFVMQDIYSSHRSRWIGACTRQIGQRGQKQRLILFSVACTWPGRGQSCHWLCRVRSVAGRYAIVRALISAALRLAIVSGKPMYSQKRLPCHDRASRSRSLKTSIFTPALGISQIYPIECLGLSVIVTPNWE
jgi:hypothetical protein